MHDKDTILHILVTKVDAKYQGQRASSFGDSKIVLIMCIINE